MISSDKAGVQFPDSESTCSFAVGMLLIRLLGTSRCFLSLKNSRFVLFASRGWPTHEIRGLVTRRGSILLSNAQIKFASGFVTIHEHRFRPTQPCMCSTHDPMIPQTGIDNITQEKTQDHGRTHNMYCMHPWHHLTQRPRTAKV
jgi:hypothetical protein